MSGSTTTDPSATSLNLLLSDAPLLLRDEAHMVEVASRALETHHALAIAKCAPGCAPAPRAWRFRITYTDDGAVMTAFPFTPSEAEAEGEE